MSSSRTCVSSLATRTVSWRAVPVASVLASLASRSVTREATEHTRRETNRKRAALIHPDPHEAAWGRVHVHVNLPFRQDARPPVPWRPSVEGASSWVYSCVGRGVGREHEAQNLGAQKSAVRNTKETPFVELRPAPCPGSTPGLKIRGSSSRTKPGHLNFDETSSGEEAQEILSLDQIPWK